MRGKSIGGRFGMVVIGSALLVLVASGQASSANTANARLFGKVTQTGRVSLLDAAGRSITTIPAGSYVITLQDKSKLQNFQVVGPSPATRKTTGIRFVGTVRWTLTLPAGTYRYYSNGSPTSTISFRVHR